MTRTLRLFALSILLAATALTGRAQLPEVGNPDEALSGMSDTTSTATPAVADTVIVPQAYPLAVHELTWDEVRDMLGLPALPDGLAAFGKGLWKVVSLGSGRTTLSPLTHADRWTLAWLARWLALAAIAICAYLTTRRPQAPPPVGQQWWEAFSLRQRRHDLSWGWGTAAAGVFFAHWGAVLAGCILLLHSTWPYLRGKLDHPSSHEEGSDRKPQNP